VKKGILCFITVLALVLGLALCLVAPVTAQQATASLVMVIWVDPSTTTPTGTLHYTVVLMNLSMPGAHNATVDINFYPPGPTGAAGAYGAPIVLDVAKTINVGESITYNWNGAGGALARPALAVDLGAIPLNPGVTTVYAASEFDGSYIFTPPYVAYDIRNVPAGITQLEPNTLTTIAANTTTVPTNGKVRLNVTEQNTGSDNLTSPRVEVRQNGVLIATLNKASAYYVSGDTNGNSKLDTTETWHWNNILSNPISAATTFEALGFGTDSLSHEISYVKGYLGERDDVTVGTLTVGWQTYPVDKAAVLAPLIGLAAAVATGAGLLALRRRRLQS
jgi:hypothetical protein